VRHGKGDNPARCRSPPASFTWPRAPVFCTLHGGRVDPSYVRHLLPRQKAHIDRRVHAHGLRHTYASELAREHTPINVIRDALGHVAGGHRPLPARRRADARDRHDPRPALGRRLAGRAVTARFAAEGSIGPGRLTRGLSLAWIHRVAVSDPSDGEP
jgi:hypothetical protein